MAIPAVPGGVGTVEAAVPFILATGFVKSYAEAALAVLAWRVFSILAPDDRRRRRAGRRSTTARPAFAPRDLLSVTIAA